MNVGSQVPSAHTRVSLTLALFFALITFSPVGSQVSKYKSQRPENQVPLVQRPKFTWDDGAVPVFVTMSTIKIGSGTKCLKLVYVP